MCSCWAHGRILCFARRTLSEGTEKEQRRKEEISDIAKKWYYLSGDERKDILDINNVTNYEQSVIEKLSQNITKYKNIINARGNKKMEGVSFNEE